VENSDDGCPLSQKIQNAMTGGALAVVCIDASDPVKLGKFNEVFFTPKLPVIEITTPAAASEIINAVK
jgi:hypothetical protein